jgi:hypothetical protein
MTLFSGSLSLKMAGASLFLASLIPANPDTPWSGLVSGDHFSNKLVVPAIGKSKK